MPFRSGAKVVEEEDGHQKPVYRGKKPLKTSDLVYIEQIPGILDIDRSTYANPSRPGFHSSYMDLLDRFPSPPSSLPMPPRNPSNSMNSNTIAYAVDQTHCYSTGRGIHFQRAVSTPTVTYPTSTTHKSLGTRTRTHSRQCREFPITPVLLDGGQEILDFQENPPLLGSVAPRRPHRFLSQSHDPVHSPQCHRPYKSHPNPPFSCRKLNKPSNISLRSRVYSGAGRGQ